MTRDELEHAIRASCDIAGDTEVWVFGSQAILGEHRYAPDALRQSIEVDVAPKNHPERTDLINGALGEYSLFHQTHGFYVHGLPIESAVLPEGWQTRTIAVPGGGREPSTGWCIEGHDLAASKLAASREEDYRFVRTLIVEELIDPEVLIQRVLTLAIASEQRKQMTMWIEINSI